MKLLQGDVGRRLWTTQPFNGGFYLLPCSFLFFFFGIYRMKTRASHIWVDQSSFTYLFKLNGLNICFYERHRKEKWFQLVLVISSSWTPLYRERRHSQVNSRFSRPSNDHFLLRLRSNGQHEWHHHLVILPITVSFRNTPVYYFVLHAFNVCVDVITGWATWSASIRGSPLDWPCSSVWR